MAFGYLLLLLACLACWYLSFCLGGYELLSPASIVFLGFAVSLALAIVGLAYWNGYPLSDEAVLIVLSGFAGTLAAACVGNALRPPKSRGKYRLPQSGRPYRTPTWKYVAVTLVILGALAIRITETVKLGGQLGLDTSEYAALSRDLRNAMSTLFSTDAITSGISFSFVERQLEKFVMMAGFVASFTAARAAVGRSARDVGWSLVILAGCCAFQIAAGGRGMIFYWVISFFVSGSFFLYRGLSRKGRFRVSGRIIAIGLLAALLCALFMYFAGGLVGRSSKTSLLDYVSFYFGGSVPSLQILLDSGMVGGEISSSVANTFYNAHLLLFKLGALNDLPPYSVAWVDCGGHQSNIFTCFCRYYADFGLAGVFSLSFLSTWLAVAVYNHARDTMSPCAVVAASYLCAYAFDCARDEFVFSRLLGTTQLANLCVLLLLTAFMTGSLVYKKRTAATCAGGDEDAAATRRMAALLG